ncbi:MAG: hypothetical protein KTR31_00640 [Myxococcales bacterium]|nr:hypothetical protein [Myxococcales bacterium]
MTTDTPRGWMFTLGLAALAVLGALAARTVQPPAAEDQVSQTDSCFRYGRFECCIKDD